MDSPQPRKLSYWMILLVAGTAVFLLFERQQWGELDSALMEEAETATETIARSGTGSTAPIIQRLSEERDLGPSRRVWLIRGKQMIACARLPCDPLLRKAREEVEKQRSHEGGQARRPRDRETQRPAGLEPRNPANT